MERRAVITGIGLMTPLGNTPESFYRNALQGVCRIGPIRKFNPSGLPVRIGAEIDWSGESASLAGPRDEMSTAAGWAVLATQKALADAGLILTTLDPYDLDVVVGVSYSSIEKLRSAHLCGDGAGLGRAPHSVLMSMNPVSAATQISRQLGLCGEVVNLTTSCSSSTSAIGYALRLIQSGQSRCVITGGADEGLCPLFLGVLGHNDFLSRRNDDPGHASRPFDRQRDGGVLSDAACILVLEECQSARARGASIYAEVAGFGATSGAAGGRHEEPAVRALQRALAAAECNADEVDYYCALGISDPKLDARETRVLKAVFGDHARHMPASSIKSMMGHPLGASGAVQAATCAMAIRRNAVPPTINYEEPDPSCDLDYVPNQGRDWAVRRAALYTLGNGGNNTALLLKAC